MDSGKQLIPFYKFLADPLLLYLFSSKEKRLKNPAHKIDELYLLRLAEPSFVALKGAAATLGFQKKATPPSQYENGTDYVPNPGH